MSKAIEYEQRVMISKITYDQIINDVLLVKKNFKQCNEYIDTPDLKLRQKHFTLRIRTIDNGVKELTLKYHLKDGNQEITDLLTVNEYQDFINNGNLKKGDVFSFLKERDLLNGLIVITKLVTNRIEVDYGDYLLVIDKNQYGKITDYNLEIESDSMQNANKAMLMYAEKYHFIYKKDCPSKSSRAISNYLLGN